MRDRLSRPDGAREQEEEGGAEEGVKVVGLSSGARHLGNKDGLVRGPEAIDREDPIVGSKGYSM